MPEKNFLFETGLYQFTCDEEYYFSLVLQYKDGGGTGDLKHTFSTDYEIILCSNNGKELTGKRIESFGNAKKTIQRIIVIQRRN